jgi:hypothetical protein
MPVNGHADTATHYDSQETLRSFGAVNMITKTHILQEIKRIAEANGGKSPGQGGFASETGIQKHEWQRHWARWNDALGEAGLSPNQLQNAYSSEELIAKYAQLACELRRLPTSGDIRVKAHSDPGFPCSDSFLRGLGRKPKQVEQLLAYCQDKKGYEDVIHLCEEYVPRKQEASDESAHQKGDFGFVYLISSGRFYKIGQAKDADYRVGAIRLQLPERAKRIHAIRTDDPSRIEAYWHKRFEAKRKNGEWFDLNATDVAAFKRRKFM